mgnify:CR=1 FL=1
MAYKTKREKCIFKCFQVLKEKKKKIGITTQSVRVDLSNTQDLVPTETKSLSLENF